MMDEATLKLKQTLLELNQAKESRNGYRDEQFAEIRNMLLNPSQINPPPACKPLPSIVNPDFVKTVDVKADEDNTEVDGKGYDVDDDVSAVAEEKFIGLPVAPSTTAVKVPFMPQYHFLSVDKIVECMELCPVISNYSEKTLENFCTSGVCINAPMNKSSQLAASLSLSCTSHNFAGLKCVDSIHHGLDKPPPLPPEITYSFASIKLGLLIDSMLGMSLLAYSCINFKGLATLVVPIKHKIGKDEVIEKKSVLQPFIPVLAIDEEALLWTDGTYSLQATEQLSKQWKLMCLGEDTPVDTWMADNLPEGAIIGVDQCCVSVDTARKWEHAFSRKKQKLINTPNNLVDEIWSDRLPAAINPVVIHPVEFAENSVIDKIMDLRGRLAQENASGIIATTLDEVAWLYNKMSSEANSFMNENGMEVRKYEAVSSDVVLLSSGRLEGSLSASKEAHGKYLEDVQSDLTKNGEVNGSNKVAGNKILIWVDLGSGCYALYSKWDFRVGYYGVGGVRRQLIQIQEQTLSLFSEFLMSDSQTEPLTYGDNNYEGSIDNMNVKDKITNLKIIIITNAVFYSYVMVIVATMKIKCTFQVIGWSFVGLNS